MGRLPVSYTPGSRFKIRITPRKIVKIRNGFRTSLMGPGGATVFSEKNRNKKSRETVPFIFLTMLTVLTENKIQPDLYNNTTANCREKITFFTIDKILCVKFTVHTLI